MGKALGKLLADARRNRGWSLREAEKRTGIHNAHLSQIETGAIDKPDPSILWTLASTYNLKFQQLMQLGGHLEADDGNTPRRSLVGVALQALGDLTPAEQQEILEHADRLRKARGADSGDGS